MKQEKNEKTISTINLVAYLWKTLGEHKKQACLNIIIGVSIVLLDLAFVWATKLSIDVATGIRYDISLWQASSLLIACITIQIGCRFGSRWISALLGVKAQNRMQQKIFQRLLNCEWKGLDKFHSGDIVNRIEKDVKDTTIFLTDGIPSLISVLVQLVGAFIFLFLMDKMLATIIIIMLPTFIIISKLYMKRMRSLTRDIRQSDSRIQSTIQESIQNRMVVKALQRCNTMTDRLEAQHAQLRSKVKEKTKYSSFSQMIMNIGFSSGYLATFIWGASQLQSGAITYGALIAFVQLIGKIQTPARSLTKFIPQFISTFTAAERLMELEKVPLEKTEDTKEMKGYIGVDCQNISYSYDNKSRNIFNNFSHNFRPCTCTAILGETGAGKTTLVRAILALIKPNEGSIKLYDSTTSNIASASTRSFIAYVPQGNTLFSGSIRQNLYLGNPDATEQEMKEALNEACASFVHTLPEGIETICGEHGYGLSEGQAQRICIARALLRNSPIYIFDEATSALDNETELQLIKNITQKKKTNTLIFVTHRKAVIEYCDEVLNIKSYK